MLILTSGTISAQKGMKGVGVNLGLEASNGDISPGIGIKFDYNISNYFRLEPSLSAFGVGGDNSGVTAAVLVNIHAFLMAPRSVRPYLYAGTGFMTWRGWREDITSGGLDGGVGLDYRMSHHMSLQLEAGAMIGEEFAGKVSLGVSYNF